MSRRKPNCCYSISQDTADFIEQGANERGMNQSQFVEEAVQFYKKNTNIRCLKDMSILYTHSKDLLSSMLQDMLTQKIEFDAMFNKYYMGLFKGVNEFNNPLKELQLKVEEENIDKTLELETEYRKKTFFLEREYEQKCKDMNKVLANIKEYYEHKEEYTGFVNEKMISVQTSDVCIRYKIYIEDIKKGLSTLASKYVTLSDDELSILRTNFNNARSQTEREGCNSDKWNVGIKNINYGPLKDITLEGIMDEVGYGRCYQ